MCKGYGGFVIGQRGRSEGCGGGVIQLIPVWSLTGDPADRVGRKRVARYGRDLRRETGGPTGEAARKSGGIAHVGSPVNSSI